MNKRIQLLVLFALIAVAIAFVLPVIQRTRAQANLALCSDRLRQVGVGLIQYARLNHGSFPLAASLDGPQLELLDRLRASNCLGDYRIYYCPALQQPRCDERNFNAGAIGYYYYVASDAPTDPHLSKFLRSGISWPRRIEMGMDPHSWLMSDIWVSGVPTAHDGYRKGLNYLMLDGSVSFVGESPRQAFH